MFVQLYFLMIIFINVDYLLLLYGFLIISIIIIVKVYLCIRYH